MFVWLRVSLDGWGDVSYNRRRGLKHGEFLRTRLSLGSLCLPRLELSAEIRSIVDKDCRHHGVANQKNAMLMAFLGLTPEHLIF